MRYCPAGAVKLGQKLCTQGRARPVYPRQELPDTVKWGPEVGHRLPRQNRINCYDTGTAPARRPVLRIAVQGYLKMAARAATATRWR